MDDCIRRADAIKAFHDALDGGYVIQNDAQSERIINEIPAADVQAVVYCKDCIHRPYETVPGVRYGLTVESPDRVYKCPCFCDGDGWYSWIPDDDFFCADGERREGGFVEVDNERLHSDDLPR